MPFKFLSGTQTLYQKGINIEITFEAKSGAGKGGGGITVRVIGLFSGARARLLIERIGLSV